MGRAGVAVRAVGPSEFERFADFLIAARQDHPVGAPLGNPSPEVLLQRLHAFHEHGTGRLAVVQSGEEWIGLSVGQFEPPGLVSESPWLQIEVLCVREEWRRRGAGRALLADLAAYAQSVGADRVVTRPVSGSRSEARFLSRLGFSAVGPRRTIETTALLRRLEHPEAQRSGIEALIARRRALSPHTPGRGIAIQGRRPQSADGAGFESDQTDTAESEADGAGTRRQVRRAELMRRSSPSATSTR